MPNFPVSVNPVECSPSASFECRELNRFGHWETANKIIALKVASYLTEPVCKVREYFYTFYILNETCKMTAQKVMRAAFLTLGIVVFAVLTPVTAPMGIAVRSIVTALEARPFIYLQRAVKGKVLPDDKKISLVSHNQCYMPAGYSITDGQVTPPSDKKRMDANIRKIQELNPDIVCLYEVPDIYDAEYLSSQLLEYLFIIPVVGVRGIGPSSMMYVASKYEIAEDSIEFFAFEKGTELTGRAQFSEKGFLSFDLKSQGEKIPFATVISTHLQHSEIPGAPEESDVIARSMQMDRIVKKIQEKMKQGCVIFTGDLNQEERELNAFLESRSIHWLRRDLSVQGQSTWDGDQWCANLMGKPSSGPLVLDYTFVAGEVISIFTKIIGTGYFGLEFRSEATSDHNLLFSTIILG